MYLPDDDIDLDPDEYATIVHGIARVAQEREAARLRDADIAKEKAGKWDKYRDDPIAFFKEVLKTDPWESPTPGLLGQADVIRAIAAHDRVAIKSGHRTGKSRAVMGIAVWWIATRQNATAILTAPTFGQVKDPLWKELRFLDRTVDIGKQLGSAVPLDPSTGLHLSNGNMIRGLSVAKKENLAGIANENMLFIIDEASGFPDELWEVINLGNSAGGAKIFCPSNPTRTSGWFYELFRKRMPGWQLITLSSENTPNVIAGKKLIPGIAESEWLARVREECGGTNGEYFNDSAYMIRVRGEFPTQQNDAVIPLWAIERATTAWKRDAPPESAMLSIGVDCARYGGDVNVVQPVRGNHAYDPKELKQGDGKEIAELVIEYARMLRISTEQVRVVVDGIGVGTTVVDWLKYSKPVQDGWMYLVDLDCGVAPDDEHHEKLRDQLWFGCAAWLKDGGQLPEHEELIAELLAATYGFNIRNRKKVEGKDKMRAVLGRSPDYADALCMAVYAGPRGRSYGFSYDAAPDPRHTSGLANAWDDADEGDERGKWG